MTERAKPRGEVVLLGHIYGRDLPDESSKHLADSLAMSSFRRSCDAVDDLSKIAELHDGVTMSLGDLGLDIGFRVVPVQGELILGMARGLEVSHVRADGAQEVLMYFAHTAKKVLELGSNDVITRHRLLAGHTTDQLDTIIWPDDFRQIPGEFTPSDRRLEAIMTAVLSAYKVI